MPDISNTKALENGSDDTRIGERDVPKPASSPIIDYLQNVREYKRLSELRQKGWDNPAGDAFFQRQRQTADTADDKLARIFYDTMKSIGEEMHRHGSALTIRATSPATQAPKILDLCMAPGGFLETALRKNPEAHAVGCSLPLSAGGHKVLLPENPRVEIDYMDITMLAEDMGVTDIPPDHPDATKFLPQKFSSNDEFGLVLCDGQVLRTHERAPYREQREARRLVSTQLALGLEHLTIGGTMVVLLHKLEAIHTVSLLHAFSKFSKVALFKPAKHHAKRSSFYMIATNVQSHHEEAVRAIEKWKMQWKVATCGTEEQYRDMAVADWADVDVILDEFGSSIVRLGRPIWEIQARALEKATFIRKW